MDEMLRGGAMRKIEEGVVVYIVKHYDDIADDLFIIQTGLITRDNRNIMNLVYYVQKEHRLVKARPPGGTSFPKLGSLFVINKRLHGMMT
jgi:hypothetical protein